VKPDYWTDEDIVELSMPARLLFIGMWNYACDNGHLQDKPRQIKMRILPGDDVSIADLLAELCTQGRIERADGWITVPNLTEHQKPDRRYFTTCDKPDCIEPEETTSQRKSRRAHAVHTPGAQGATPVRTAGALGDGDGEVKGSDGDGDRTPAGKPSRATSLPSDFTPNDTNRRVAAEQRVNLDRLLPQFIDYHQAKGSTYKDWHSALNTWIRREKPDPTVLRPSYRPPEARDLEQPPDGLSPTEYASWERDQRMKRANA
jgi:translation initiation factor IF-1